jgi:hypothetical protein
MPTFAKPLPEIRQELRNLLVENLPEAHKALKELLPEGSDKCGYVINLQVRLQQLNKDKIRGVIDTAEYALRLAQISADTLDLIDSLDEPDFLPSSNGKPKSSARQGSVLYRIPQQMPMLKPTICTVRVAIDEDAILEEIVLDDSVRLRSKVEVSDRMSAELIDTEGQVFDIFAFNSAHQNVRETGYTQWLFRVTPRIQGEHQLMVKVSLLEFDKNTNEYLPREVSILETVTIITEAPAPSDTEETPFQSTGARFSVGPEFQPPTSRGMNPPSPSPGTTRPAPAPHIGAEPPEPIMSSAKYPSSETLPAYEQEEEFVLPASKSPSPMRALALFLAFLVVGSTATWAFTPPPVRDWWIASLRDSETAYQAYIETYKNTENNNPRLEKAYYFRAQRTEKLADLRAYQQAYPNGEFRYPVGEKIHNLELRDVENIEKSVEMGKIRRYLNDYPEATQLPRIKAAAERKLSETEKSEVLPLLEQAYIRSMKEEPTTAKFHQYRQDFPRVQRLQEMSQASASNPQVQQEIQPAIDSVIREQSKSTSLRNTVKSQLQNIRKDEGKRRKE